MKNWRELGEVPDSDDEDEIFDDFETTSTQDQGGDGLEYDLPKEPFIEKIASPVTKDATPKQTKEVDLWDLPSSSVAEEQPSHRKKPSRPTKEIDDHVWDLPSSSAGEERTSQNGSAKAIEGVNVDAWELRSSSAEEQLSQNSVKSATGTAPKSSIHTTPQPVSSAALTQVEDARDRPPCSSGSSSCSSIADQEDPNATPRPAKQPSQGATSFPEDEISRGYVRISTPEPRFFPDPVALESSPLSVLSSPELSRPAPARDTTQEPQSQRQNRADAPALQEEEEEEEGEDEEEMSRQAAVRLARSLRPRKPIQQHPYLLESVHYSKFMKSHGIKPVKVVVSPQSSGRRADEEDSQEQEFETEDSQDRSGDGVTQEDEAMVVDNAVDDQYQLALSPSPPKTSPFVRHLHPSSQTSTADRTDATIVSGDEEFPPIDRLKPLPKGPSRHLKRQRSQILSGKLKRQRPASDTLEPVSPRRPLYIPPPDPFNMPSSPVQPETSQLLSQDLGATPVPPARSKNLVPRSALHGESSSTRRVVDFTVFDQEDDGEESSRSGSDSASDSENSDKEDVILKNSRRIRGVLPASWLRLDQQKDVSAFTRNRRPSIEPTPRKTPRRGVALPKQTSVGSSMANPFIFSESEESDGGSTPVSQRQQPDALPVNSAVVSLIDDDAASVVEEDFVDWMLPGRKRTASSSLSRVTKRPKTTSKSTFGKPPGQFTRQPKITQVLSRSKSKTGGTSGTNRTAQASRRKSKGTSTKHSSRKKASTPPLLSILDVIEPSAPKFIKIAARTARRRPNLGKSSPSKKMISLASRNDNVDALSALQDWKSGRTKPKITVPTADLSKRPRPVSRSVSGSVLREVNTNVMPRPHGVQMSRSVSAPLKPTRQGQLDDFVSTTTPGDAQPAPSKSKVPIIRRRNLIQRRPPQFRPAQLESNEDDVDNRARRLASKKRSLDAVFRQSRRAADSISDYSSTRSFQDLLLVQEDVQRPVTSGATITVAHTPADDARTKDNKKSRFKKRQVPQHIDLEAPQYERAHDPLPPVIISIPEEADVREQQDKPQDKLGGLGPYGTQYTQHFEVFPLERGTFFHESTVIGRGYIRRATEQGLSAKIRQSRTRKSFVLDEQVLRWGPWNDKTSSELGILFDWISERVSPDSSQNGEGKVVEAASLALDYILDSLSVQGDVEQAAVILRFTEVFTSFVGRCESLDWSAMSEQAKMLLLDVFSRCLVAILSILKLSQSSTGSMAQSMKIESLLTRFSSFAIKGLLSVGLEELRTLYSDLQRLSARERGIRPRQVVANCWVVVIRVLECANIPRSSFWDVAQGVMLKDGVTTSLDARVFERHWQDMFTLLPLGEIDNDGVLIPGLRNTKPLEGWTLPQQLMKRVFQIYKTNPRQPPSFNEYCRSLVARCHFLVQLWGWRKCTGIIGTIFDFFGSQSLAHLRNEEVYKSPRFIEELHLKPSLSIESEDRCFHIFIKMLGLVIQHLKQLGRENEVKNLVTRTLPNHNRQYLKEDTVHQHELAALRNHHDLLCTLFWAAPPDRRPPVHLIEKLVTPSSAHKEACIINIRAWNQLARFVVSNGEGSEAFKPFASWRNNVFNQVLDQYMSAASDIEQQFRQLSEQMRGISTGMRDAMIAKNKATAMDVLYCSLQASLDVLKGAPNLEAVVYSFNLTQLQKVFTSLDYKSPGFDWHVLRVALETLEHYLTRLDEATEEQYSSEFAGDFDPNQLEDATLLLHEQLAKDFFWVARTTLSLAPVSSFGKRTEQANCAEKTVTLAARIAIRFINNGLSQLLAFFTQGKFCLFSNLPKNLHGRESKYLPLFTATLVKNHVFDFKSIESNILELWVLSIVKPARYLQYENHLAEILQRQNVRFLERATVLVGIKPDYNSSVDYMSCVLHHMRRSLREGGSTRSRHEREEFAKVLNLAMQRMKTDLGLLRVEAPREHSGYINFVRQIISLMKSHGVGICVIDPFFMQPGLDYSPPIQDPGLHMAGIVAYGVRLGEKEITAVPQLFFYLYNNFKIALVNGKVDQEAEILVKAMRNGGKRNEDGSGRFIVSFVLEFMLPAVVRACAAVGEEAWILLETYVAALGRVLTSGCVSRELGGQDIRHAVRGCLGSVLFWLGEVRDKCGSGSLSARQWYLLNLLVTLAGALRPSLETYLAEGPGDDAEGEHDHDTERKEVEEVVGLLGGVFSDARSHIGEVLNGPPTADMEISPPGTVADRIRVRALLSGLPPSSSAGHDKNNPRVQEFVRHITSDVRKSWVVADGLVTVKTASTGGGGPARISALQSSFSSTQAQAQGQAAAGGPAGSQAGTKCHLASADDLVRGLYVELGKWLDTSVGGLKSNIRTMNKHRRERVRDDIFF
ncbi:Mus7/MMS22 family domain containing protein [Naviculisporaceae sp. PSN 640]